MFVLAWIGRFLTSCAVFEEGLIVKGHFEIRPHWSGSLTWGWVDIDVVRDCVLNQGSINSGRGWRNVVVDVVSDWDCVVTAMGSWVTLLGGAIIWVPTLVCIVSSWTAICSIRWCRTFISACRDYSVVDCCRVVWDWTCTSVIKSGLVGCHVGGVLHWSLSGLWNRSVVCKLSWFGLLHGIRLRSLVTWWGSSLNLSWNQGAYILVCLLLWDCSWLDCNSWSFQDRNFKSRYLNCERSMLTWLQGIISATKTARNVIESYKVLKFIQLSFGLVFTFKGAIWASRLVKVWELAFNI